MVSNGERAINRYGLKTNEIGRAAEVLARAFRDYPLSIYFMPDEAGRRRKLSFMFRREKPFGRLRTGREVLEEWQEANEMRAAVVTG